MDDVQELLNMASANFHAHKQAVAAINDDPVLRQWFAIEYKSYTTALSFFNLDAMELRNTRKNYNEIISKIFKQIEHCENELGNLNTEFIHNKKGNNIRIVGQINEMQTTCSTLQDLKKDLRELAQIFHNADQKIRSSLKSDHRAALTRFCAGNKFDSFDLGCRLYEMASEDETDPKRPPLLTELFLKANELQTALERLELPNMPGVAREIIMFQIEKAIRACQMIKDFSEEAAKLLGADIKQIQALKIELGQCNQAELTVILNQGPVLIETLSKSFINLNYLSHLLNHLIFFTEQLYDLKMFYKVLRIDFLPALTGKADRPDSPLNPTCLAEDKANHFFSGISGLIRTIKMLFASLSGKKVVSDLELRNKITETIKHCPIYFSKKPTDLARMEEFIHGYLDGFSKPFPYDSLFQVIKNVLAVYGDRIECFFNDFKIDPDKVVSISEFLPVVESKPPGKLGSLMKRIEKRLTTEIKI
ncbi:MAG: hypothetical protein A2511_03760 [Deltaproteobacteria bacterium RIFOXYD12_FULL_50_9]|nr:MAG: hypothetical protein A2511_03760 [Deltaproteobacteria bacterium RIFOXYD12_FULL_50_9]